MHAAIDGAGSTSLADRVSLLLLGDSRDRVLFGQTQSTQCTGKLGGCRGTSRLNGTGAEHCYNFQWASPSHFPIASYWQSTAGAHCRNDTRLAAFGYFLHYGVSSSGPYLHDWSTHGHPRWAGPGWSDACNVDGDSTCILNSAALAIEAARRFMHRSPQDSRVHILFSSLLWDLGRRYEHHRRQSVGAWMDEYRANYTRIIDELHAALTWPAALHSRRLSTVLALSTPFDVPSAWPFFEGNQNATAVMTDAAAAHVRAVARARGLPLVDWHRSFRNEAARSSERLIDAYGHPSIGAGVRLAWREVERALMRTSTTST